MIPEWWHWARDGGVLLLLALVVATGLHGDWMPRLWHDEVVSSCTAQLQDRDRQISGLEKEATAWQQAALGQLERGGH